MRVWKREVLKGKPKLFVATQWHYELAYRLKQQQESGG
jgi:hypothetical protein